MDNLLAGWGDTFQAGKIKAAVQPTAGDADAKASERSVVDTLGLMAGHVARAIPSSQVQAAVQACGCNQPGTDDATKIQRVFDYIKSRVTFVEDKTQLARMYGNPNSKELLITPPVLLSMQKPRGDCDDFSMLGAAMLGACGVRTAFKTIAANRESPETYSHVYLICTQKNGQVVPFDSSHGKAVGWEHNVRLREMVWPLINVKGEAMLGDFWDDVGAGGGTQYGAAPIDTGSGFNWGSVIPGLFATGEKIGIQLTQKPGYQQVAKDGSTTSYVLPDGASASALSIPGLTTGSASSGTLLLLGGAALIAVFLFSRGK